MPRTPVWAALALAAGLAAQAPSTFAQSPSPAAAEAPARVRFLNREIAELRMPFLTASPAQRAIDAERRIERTMERGGPGRASNRAIDQGMAITLDGVLVFMLVPGDTDTLGGESLEIAAGRATEALNRAAAEWHEAHDFGQMLQGIGWAAVATLIFGLLLTGLRRFHGWLCDAVESTATRHAARVRIGGIELLHGEIVGKLARRVLLFLSMLVGLVLGYGWITFIFRRFPFTRPWGEELRGLLVSSLSTIFGQIFGALPNLIVAVMIFILARFVTRTLDAFFLSVETRELELGWLDRDTVPPTRRIASMVIWLFALVMAYPYLPGSDSEAFKGLSVLVGLMISLGASSVIGQGASGLVLMYSRSFRAGELVRIGESEGKLVELGMFATRLRTAAGVELTIPNAVVLGTVTRNHSRSATRGAHVVETAVTIGYDAPWRLVRAMLLEAARRTPGVLADPPPRVYQAELSEFYVVYRLLLQVRLEEGRSALEVRDELHANIQDQFNEHGVQIMSPAYEGDPERPKVVPKAKWNVPPVEPGSG